MLKNIYKINFEIELVTGLHIGGSTDTFDIGGADATVIKNPLTHEPYIPGSSLKGKLRSLLSHKYAMIKDDKYVIQNDTIRSLFEPVEKENSIMVSRAIFRDMMLTEESKDNLQRFLGKGVFTEIKAENSINELNGKAANPRFIERVPAGAVFGGEIIIHSYNNDEDQKLQNGILEAFKLLELHYLGGNGTRGYGRIKINHNGFKRVEF